MAKSYSDTWKLLEPVIAHEGYSLFDLEMPLGSRLIRVFIASAKGDKEPISIADCEKVSRRIKPLLEVEGVEDDDFILEVSSPGINRRLRRKEHFMHAVGEQVLVTVRKKDTDSKDRTSQLKGTLTECDGENITVKLEKDGEAYSVPLRDVLKARVDYKF